jgi:hypothetical protein
MSEFPALMVMVLRISVGDLHVPKDTLGKGEFYFLIWFIWLLNLVLMPIILMNFLIAVISNSFVEVESKETQYMYKDMADINLDYQ